VDVAELSRWIEEKVAPEPLIAVQALADSADFEASSAVYDDEEEKLGDVASARDWLAGLDLVSNAIEISEADLAELHELRRCIRALIEANTTGTGAGGAGADLAAIAARHPVPLSVSRDGRVGLDLEPAGSVDALIAQMIGIVMQAQVEGTWERLKICAADTCRWAFFDASKNRGGHWCSMQLCGNREKNRAYRERNASGATS
jgi:predicted RNA-binding Zn ribbon-like protein